MTQPVIDMPTTAARSVPKDLDRERVAEFARELEALRREVELDLGESDAQHIRRIGQLSSRLEILGRSLIQLSFEPVGFSLGTAALWAHKTLELMEIGHMALHGCYDGLPDTQRFQSEDFRWKAPIDEDGWKTGHNLRHHQFTNIAGKDPDLDFGMLRLSARIAWKPVHALQPLTNYLTWLGFASAINMHVTGVLSLIGQEAGEPEVKRTAFNKWLRYYGREYGLFPLLAGPFFPKVLLANALSELGRDLYAAAIIYCGHVGTDDYENDYVPATRADWYVMQAEAARDVNVPGWVSILCGGLDLQIEHHLFPRLPPNRLRDIAPRVRALCAKYGVRHRSDSWPVALRGVVRELSRLREQAAAPL